MLRWLLLPLLLGLTACGGGSDRGGSDRGATTGTELTIAGAEALTWGDGGYGVVLAHGASYDAASWEAQATVIAEQETTVIAVEDISPDGIRAAVEQLQADGIDDVALVGGSAGADAILQLASAEPGLPDQLILLSPNSPVEGLGEEPKLFVASQEEGVAEVSTQLAESAAGRDNEVKLLPGSAHAQGIFKTDQGEAVLDLILQRLRRYA